MGSQEVCELKADFHRGLDSDLEAAEGERQEQ